MPWLLGPHDSTTEAPPLLAHLLHRYTAHQLAFLLHVAGGGIALAAGPWQLMPRLRARRPRLHRATGLVYVGAVAVAASAGLVMGPFAWGGTSARLGFTALAFAWLGTTALGVHRITSGDRFFGHAVWMQRSFALAFSAVSLRIQFPLSSFNWSRARTAGIANGYDEKSGTRSRSKLTERTN
jgi:hypothetical protein